MKFLIFGLLCITAAVHFCAGQASTRASLLARAQSLETRATAEIAALTAANRTAAAAGLQRQERLLETLVAEITALPANASAAELLRLETRLAELEAEIAAELRLLGATGRFRRQALNLATLLSRATALEANATAEIAVLTASNRSAQAATLQRQITQLEALVTEIQGLNATAPEAELRRLETRLADLESTIFAELRRLAGAGTGTGRFRRQATTRAALLARAQNLETRATAEIAALTAANRTAAAAGLQRQERLLETLVAEITALPANASAAELLRLETRLAELEAEIAAELRLLGATGRFRRQALNLATLITRATALEANATAEIAVLVAANRTAVAAELQRQERLIRTLVAEIQALPANASEAELRRLETRLAEVESAVAAELRRLTAGTGTTGTGRFRRQAVTRESLIARGEALITRARADVAALRAAGKTAEATRLEGEVRVIETLVTDLRNLRTTALTEAELRVLENALNEAENRFEAELVRIEASSAF